MITFACYFATGIVFFYFFQKTEEFAYLVQICTLLDSAQKLRSNAIEDGLTPEQAEWLIYGLISFMVVLLWAGIPMSIMVRKG